MHTSFPMRRVGAPMLIALAALLVASVLLTSSGQATPVAVSVGL